MDPYAVVPVTLRGDHHIGLIQHKHCNLLRVDEFVLVAPVEDCARCSNDNLLLQLDTPLHCKRNSRSSVTENWLLIYIQ